MIKNMLIMISLFALLNACAQKSLRVSSEPAGANIYLGTKLVGTTPVELNSKDHPSEFSNDILDINLEAPGYENRNLLVSSSQSRDVSINLVPIDQNSFKKNALNHYKNAVNSMIREILQIQGALFAKKYDLAEENIKKFIQVYPNIAAPYVLQAQIEMTRGQTAAALANLKRAVTLDPEDSVATRMIQRLSNGKGT